MVAARERYVVAGLARARAEWFRAVGQWATAGAAPIEFVRCVSVAELRGRLPSGRPFSAVLLEAELAGVDRDLIAVAREAGAAVVVVTDTAHRDWAALGASAVLPTTMTRDHLLDTLSSVASPVQQASTTAPRPDGADAEGRVGRIVAVTGSGGVGTSTVAIAAAQGLGQGLGRALGQAVGKGTSDEDAGRDVLLADLQRDAEQAMLHDTRVVVPGIQELVEAHRAGVPSGDQIREQTFAIEARGYALLLGLRRSRQWVTLRPRALEAALASLARAFEVVVYDVGADLEGEVETGSVDVEERNLPARLAIGAADVVLTVGEPTLKGLYSLVRVIADVIAFGTPASQIVPVLNRAPRSPKKRAELARALADLVSSEGGPRDLPNPVFLPSRAVEQAVRDGVALPKPLPATVAGAVAAALARAPAPTAAPAREPVSVAPGSLGVARDPGRGAGADDEPSS